MGILVCKAQLIAPLGAMCCRLALDCWDCERIGLAHASCVTGRVGLDERGWGWGSLVRVARAVPEDVPLRVLCAYCLKFSEPRW
jgi:hypothetical protein